MASTSRNNGVTPAQLGFLAIFNPSLGNTDETIDDQIVYYTSITSDASSRKSKRARSKPTLEVSQEERNERLRQIGLAQGMVSFGKGFADGATVDVVDTDKSRVVLRELEPGWWILASVDLTKIPVPPRLPTKTAESHEEQFEYSTREMKPAALLLRDLLRAHSLFLMHHDTSLSALFVRAKRSRFTTMLSRYWDLFLSTWSVMLHGNPMRGILGGINIAASGELGFGVGEEDRGSGEREVLEGLVGRMEGLTDLVVAKFGDEEGEDATAEGTQWLGTGQDPGAQDGAIFLGTGALSRKSLRDVTHWLEDLYTWGEHAYGVIESPTSTRRRKRRGSKAAEASAEAGRQDDVKSPETEPSAAQGAVDEPSNTTADTSKENPDEDGKLDKMVSYLKLGYGTYWSLPGSSNESTHKDAPTQPQTAPSEPVNPTPNIDMPPITRPSTQRTASHDSDAHYLIGLRGHIIEGDSDHDLLSSSADSGAETDSRVVVRTINVELEGEEGVAQPDETIVRDFEHPGSMLTRSQVQGNMMPGYSSHDLNKARKLRVVVYANRPFLFAFLFEIRTDSLAWDSLYRSLHYQLSPLRKPLLASTSHGIERPKEGSVASGGIQDLVWDPNLLTVHCTIPNIPEQYTPADSWSRADALNTHLHLLNLHSTTRSRKGDLERTEKTSRGWWIVWTRLAHMSPKSSRENLTTINEDDGPPEGHRGSAGSKDTADSVDTGTGSQGGQWKDKKREATVEKEIYLIRRASDHARYRSEGGSEGAGRLMQGIGVDTRRYVEELLSLL